jgi:hypothetical protein
MSESDRATGDLDVVTPEPARWRPRQDSGTDALAVQGGIAGLLRIGSGPDEGRAPGSP